jgi:hypothetical protein
MRIAAATRAVMMAMSRIVLLVLSIAARIVFHMRLLRLKP